MPRASLMECVCVWKVPQTPSRVLPCEVWNYIKLLPGNETMNCFPMSSENICRFALIYPNVSNKTATPWQTCPSNPGVSLTKTWNYQAATVKELSKVDFCLTDCSLTISPFLGVGPSWLRRMGRMQWFLLSIFHWGNLEYLHAYQPVRAAKSLGKTVMRLMLWRNSSRKSFQNWPECILQLGEPWSFS